MIRVLEGEEREQGIENLCEKAMRKSFPNLVKEIDKSRKHRESQTEGNQRGPHQDTSSLKCQRLKTKNLKSSKRKSSIYRGTSIKLSARNIQSDEKQGGTTKIIYPAKLSFRI